MVLALFFCCVCLVHCIRSYSTKWFITLHGATPSVMLNFCEARSSILPDFDWHAAQEERPCPLWAKVHEQ